MALPDLDTSAQMGYLLRAVEELTRANEQMREELLRHMDEEIEIKKAMDARVAQLELAASRARGYLLALTSVGSFVGALLGIVIDKVL